MQNQTPPQVDERATQGASALHVRPRSESRQGGRPRGASLTRALAVALSVLALPHARAQTTTLAFDSLVSYYSLLHGYGDRVTGASSGGFTYTGTGSFTPNVLASFGARELAQDSPLFPYPTGYNDLFNVIYANPPGLAASGSELRLTLTADPGFRVSLEAFDLGNWGLAIVLPYVRVTNEDGAVLFEELAVSLNAGSSTIERNFVLTPAPAARILTLRISLEGLLGNADNVGLDNVRFRQQSAPVTELGVSYCAPATANSSTGPGRIRLWGQPTAAANDVRLVATGLPFSSFGFFLTSRTQGSVVHPGGSQGVLCLGGAIGRYVGAGQIVSSSVGGNFELRIDLAQMPSPVGAVAAQAGQTWNFTAWFRDANPHPTSNFTDAVALLLQ